jgi:tetratricopeptide (TPR) repeat protein
MLVVRAGRDARLVPLLEEALQLLPEGEVELRGRLLGRLAGALRDEPSPERRDALSREAVELARAAENDVALAFALEGRAAAILSPDTVEEVNALGSELVAVGERIGDRERVVQGYSYRLMTRLMLGDLEGAMLDRDRQRVVHGELGQPIQGWQVDVDLAMLALNNGRLEEAEELIGAAFAVGERAIPELAIPACVFQRYVLADLRGDPGPMETEMRAIVAAHPARRVFACALAHIHARTGHPAEIPDAATLIFDQEWLVAMSLVAETAWLLGRRDLAPGLYDTILPYAHLTAVDLPEATRGSMSRSLGQLALLMERWEDAAEHYEEAIRTNRRMGAAPWLALAEREYDELRRRAGSPRA